MEMIRTGTVRFWDMYWHAGATGRAVEDAGLRATIAAPLIDVGAAAGKGELREAEQRSLEEIGPARELIAPALAPHAVYTVSEPSLRWIAEAAEARELPVHIHLSETEDEVAPLRCGARGPPGRVPRPARTAGAADAACPRGRLDEGEIQLIAARGARWSPILSPT